MGGEILQVTFDSTDVEDELQRKHPYVLVSQNFEFADPPTIKWYDGKDYDGGAKILKIVLAQTKVRIDTDKVNFSVSEQKYSELGSYLTRIFPKCEIINTP